jgi:hypothetical protein
MLPDRRAKQGFAWLIECRYNNSPLKTAALRRRNVFSCIRAGLPVCPNPAASGFYEARLLNWVRPRKIDAVGAPAET